MPHLITQERVVGRFEVPWRGVNQLVRADMLPPDALREASNVLPREGQLRLRPGYAVFDQAAASFTGTPTGIFAYLKGAADPIPVLGTTSRIYAYVSGAWADKSGTPPTAAVTQPARFTTLAIGSPPVNYVIHTNGKDTPAQWNGTAATFSTITGAPLWTDVCTIADRLIGIVAPYLVQWGSLLKYDVYPDLNKKIAAESVDAAVALRPLGQGFNAVLYKERSLWPVTFTGGQTEAQAFRIGPEPIGFWDGPASPAAVVDVGGQHVYMTPTGRIAAFSGSQHAWIADGAWPVIQADLDASKASRIWGVFDPAHDEVHFVYPSLAVSSQMRGWVGVTLPKPSQGIPVFGAFPGRLTTELSAGATVRLTDKLDRLLVAGAKSYTLSMATDTDAGTAFAANWRTGILALPGLEPLRLESVETFAQRGDGYGQLDLRLVTSWVLANDGSLDAVTRKVGLGDATEPSTGATGQDIKGRFVGLRYDVADSSAVTLGWKGATLVAMKRGK